jgi:protein-S-isoprenylcysteine O-methyltransferase Ste14
MTSLIAIGLILGGSSLFTIFYAISVQPAALGEMLMWFGIALLLNSLTLFVLSLVWIPIFIGFTVIEDNDLALRFGEPYLEYSRRVGIFGPNRK